MQNIPLGFHSSKLKKWTILLFIIPLMATISIKGLLYQQEPIITVICTLGLFLLSVVILTPNVTLTNESIAIEHILSTRHYSFQDYKSLSKASVFFSKIHFDDGRNYWCMNGTTVSDILKSKNIENRLHERILGHIENRNNMV